MQISNGNFYESPEKHKNVKQTQVGSWSVTDQSWSVPDQSWSVEPPPTNFFNTKSHLKLAKKSWSVANRKRVKRVKRNFLLLLYFLSTDQLFFGSFKWDLVSKKLVGG